jgi:hypothetical protein
LEIIYLKLQTSTTEDQNQKQKQFKIKNKYKVCNKGRCVWCFIKEKISQVRICMTVSVGMKSIAEKYDGEF